MRFILIIVLTSACAMAQPIVRSFEGDAGPGLEVCQTFNHCDRPEMDVGTNGKQVVQVTWQNVLVYDPSGRLLKSTPMAEFIRNTGLDPIPPKTKGPYEPHITYNEFIGRWMMTVTGLNDCLLVSATSDFMSPWKGVYLSCLDGGPCLNYDAANHIGFDKNGVYQ